MVDPLYHCLNAMRLRNYTRCAELCRQIPIPQQKEKWYLICRTRTEESWTDFTEPDDLSAADIIFDEHVISELPRPGTSLRVQSRSSRPVTASGRPVSGYAHPSSQSGGGNPTASASAHFSRLATASLVMNGDEPDVTSMNVAKFARSPFLSRILVDYLIHRLRDPVRAIALAAECTTQHGFNDWWWKNRLGRAYYLLGLYAEAEAQFKSALNTAVNVESRLELAKLYIRYDQPLKALTELETGFDQFPRMSIPSRSGPDMRSDGQQSQGASTLAPGFGD
jgi:tetratricopeptide repeat protein 8